MLEGRTGFALWGSLWRSLGLLLLRELALQHHGAALEGLLPVTQGPSEGRRKSAVHIGFQSVLGSS